jgi:hypothetical protein
MAGFVLRKGHADIEEWTISSLTLSAGDLLEMDVGATAATEADSSTLCYQRKGVCMEDATTSDTTVKVMVVDSEQEWEVESANNSSSSDNGDAMVLTDKNTVNNTGTNSTAKEAVVIQIKPVGAAADAKIRVKFTSTSSGLTHDAT